MMTVISGRMQASRPHRSGLYPLLRAIDIVSQMKMTQKKTKITHQKNDNAAIMWTVTCTPLPDGASSHMPVRQRNFPGVGGAPSMTVTGTGDPLYL